jgi:hypothetical protein
VKPDSLMARARRHVARLLEPRPDPGEAWCIACRLNGGRTLVLSADGHSVHTEEHHSSGENGRFQIIASWPGNAADHDPDEGGP